MHDNLFHCSPGSKHLDCFQFFVYIYMDLIFFFIYLYENILKPDF